MSGLWLARRGSRSATGLAALLRPAHAAALLTLPFFAIGTASARYAIALNVHLAANVAGAISRASSLLQAWQHAMILLAPTIGRSWNRSSSTPR